MHFLVTAGPTHEPIDAVRYIGNRSSGRMGLAIAAAAVEAGHQTTLLLGPVPLSDREIDAVFPPPSPAASGSGVATESPSQPMPRGPELLRFRTSEELRVLLHRHWPRADVLIMAAAVADFRPANEAVSGKLERGAELHLHLVPVPDLLAELKGQSRPDQRRVGFALEEPERLAERATAKLGRKGLDAIVANPLETMDAAGVAGQVFLPGGRVLRPPEWPQRVPKEAFARWLLSALHDEWSVAPGYPAEGPGTRG